MSAVATLNAPLAVDIRDVHVRYGQDPHAVHALAGVSLTMGTGQSVAVVGPSGSGKSSLISLLAGLAPPTSGTVLVFGEAPSAAAALPVGVMLQNPARNLFALATATENVMLVARAVGAGRTAARTRAGELLAATGLSSAGDKRIRELSGGEQQRLALAVALANSPRLLLADEPTSQLDRASGEQVAQLLQRVHLAGDMAVVVVTHDHAVADLFDRTVEIRDGQLTGAVR